MDSDGVVHNPIVERLKRRAKTEMVWDAILFVIFSYGLYDKRTYYKEVMAIDMVLSITITVSVAMFLVSLAFKVYTWRKTTIENKRQVVKIGNFLYFL